MAYDPHANFSYSTVATAPSPATSGTSLVVQSGDGAAFPAVSFNATIWPAGVAPTKANAEIVRVTAVSTDTFTIIRAQEGSTARSVVVGDQIAATVTAKTMTDMEQAVIAGFCGDGSDGNVTISTTVSLTRDMFYDTLTVSGTGVLKNAAFKIYCKTALIVQSGGVIQANGNDATSSTGASVLPTGSIGGSGSAGISGGTASTSNQAGTNYAWGGQGGTGGNGSGGTGGLASAGSIFASDTSPRAFPMSTTGHYMEYNNNNKAVLGGTGGNGGAGDGTAGGGGGSGGGVIVINARSISNSGTISANGGAGFAPTAGNRGGGGGGGGGVVLMNTTSFTGNSPVANGGAGGAGFGTGTAGATGSAGKALLNIWT